MPPGTDIGGFLSEYVRNEAESENSDPDIQVLALSTMSTLKISSNVGARQKMPGREEIKALLIGKPLTTTVFFLDETFEEITYGIATTVADAVEVLLDFSFCMCRYIHDKERLEIIISTQKYKLLQITRSKIFNGGKPVCAGILCK